MITLPFSRVHLSYYIHLSEAKRGIRALLTSKNSTFVYMNLITPPPPIYVPVPFTRGGVHIK